MSLRRIFAATVFSTAVMTVCLISYSAPAFADSTNTQFTVTATVLGSCTISATNADLGTYSPAAASDGTATITYQCTPGLTPTIDLDAGLNGLGNPHVRAMSNGSGGLLGYNIYTSNAYTTLWGDGSDGTSGQSVTADGNSDNITAYVQAAGGETTAAEGSYTDTVTATINW